MGQESTGAGKKAGARGALGLAVVLGLWLVAACGVPEADWQFQRALLDADRLGDRGEHAAAAEAYRELAWEARRPEMVSYIVYRVGLMEARQGDEEAARATWARLAGQPESVHDRWAARAYYASASLVGENPGERVAELRDVMLRFPHTTAAIDALEDLRRHWVRSGQPERFMAFGMELLPVLERTDIAARMIYRMGEVLLEELDDPAGAIPYFRTVTRVHVRSGFVDNATWAKAEAWRALGESTREERVLQNFIDSREVSVVMGNYDSPLHGPTLMRLAEIRAEAGDVRGQIAVLQRFVRTFPLSLQVPERLHEIMTLQASVGDVAGMRRTLAALAREFPESRWLERGRALLETAEARR